MDKQSSWEFKGGKPKFWLHGLEKIKQRSGI